MHRYLLLAPLLLLCCTLKAQDLSNKGREFWLGYGHNQLFNASGGGQELVLYLSAEQPATVTVSINGTSYSETYSVPANTAIQTNPIPKTGINNARIETEGISSKGIHIQSDVPIVAYAHQYGSSSSGATMLMPVETFGYTYYSLNYTQLTNATPAYSWFFIVASENNTRLQITPSGNTQGGWTAGNTYTVELSKGQIYNVFGQPSGTSGVDLSGSKIASVAGSDGKCHPVGVFSGASRMVICSGSGGDFMQQQIFPASAWGTKYLTYPTMRAGTTSSTYLNFFRIAVRDPSTVVKRNGVVLTGLINNFYYEYSSAAGDYIESDKPVLVSQYIPSQAACNGYSTGDGDPEMFYLSPLEQAIKKATFYVTGLQNINQNYVCIIVPTSAMNSLRIDGSNAFDFVGLHPQNTSYRVVIKRWTQTPTQPGGQHTIECDSTFTAIAYGMGGPESYGYNAGTMINNLDAQPTIANTLNTTTAANTFTCKNTPFQFSIKLSFKPTQMQWKFSQVNNLSPNTDTTLNNPVAVDSQTIGSRKYYIYKINKDYKFSDTGTYTIPITVTAPNIDNCNNTMNISNYTVRVEKGPGADFSWVYSGCVSDTARFSGIAIPGTFTGVNRYRWTFDDGSIDSIQNPKKLFNGLGNHPTLLQVIADNGCIGDTTKIVVTTTGPVATFGMSTREACGSATVTFTDTSSFAGGSSLDEFYWDFGNGITLTSTSPNPQTQTYSSPGEYIIRHWAGVQGGCKSAVKVDTVKIYAFPATDFSSTTGCLQDSTVQFTDQTPALANQTFIYSWDFGEPSSGANNLSSLQNPTHRYASYGPFNVQLKVTTNKGCSTVVTKPYTVQGFGASINFTVANENNLCVQKLVQVTNNMNVVADSVYRIDMYWDAANQPTIFTTDNTPTINEIHTNLYPDFTSPASKTITIKWVVYGKGGCISEKTKTITLHATPALSVSFVPGKCVNAPVSNLAFGTITNGLTGNATYYGTGMSSNGDFNPANPGSGTATVGYTFTSAAGCVDSIPNTVRVFPKPVAAFNVSGDICLSDSVLITNASTICCGSIKEWRWNYGDAISDDVKLNGNPFYKSYTSAGNYNIRLVAVSDSACTSDTTIHPVNVLAAPTSAFTVSGKQCGDSTITITSTSSFGTGAIQRWHWNINGTVINATNNNPIVRTFAPGNYIVKHVVEASGGCLSDTLTQTLTIYANPVADFNSNSATCLIDSTSTFTDLTNVPDGQSLSWNWNFGEPFSGTNTSSLQNPAHKYAGYGTFPVTLSVTTANGCSHTIVKNYTVGGFLPAVNFAVLNDSVCSSQAINIQNNTNLVSDSIYRVDIYWDAVGQPTTFITDNNPAAGESYTHIYNSFSSPSSQIFTIKLVMYSKGGCTTEKTKTITLFAVPQVTFATLTGRCVNAGISSVALASATNVPGSGYYIGTGTDAAGNFDPAVAGVGQHQIKYVFQAIGGCVDTARRYINVFPKPTASFAVTPVICLGDSVLLTDNSSISQGALGTRHWDFGNGNTSIAAAGDPFHYTYPAYGNFNVKMYVQSDSACLSDTVSQPVIVHAIPEPDFIWPAAICMSAAGGTVQFTNNTNMPGGSATALNYTWNFGDLSTSGNRNPLHTYAVKGSYNVTLTASTSNGCSKDITKTVANFFDKPIADFDIDRTELCQGQENVFTDQSTAPGSTVTAWLWNYNNGATDSARNPKYTFVTPGTYNVSLVVTSAEGCISDASNTIVKVNLQPIVNTGARTLYVPDGATVQVLTTANDPNLKFKWTPSIYFLTSDTILRPSIKPNLNQLYYVTATGDGGCTAYDSVFVKVMKYVKIPNAFSPNNDGINDKWQVFNLENYPDARIEIYNRYGHKVFSSRGFVTPWDGKLNGKDLPIGTYYYIIEPNDNGYGKLTGSITLLR